MSPAGRSRLTSPPFIGLYIASIGAVTLNVARHYYGSTWWFPLATGLTAAVAIIAVKELLSDSLVSQRPGSWVLVVFFLICAGLPLIGFALMDSKERLARGLAIGMSAIFFLAALATLFRWPGFRGQSLQDGCSHCGYDLFESDRVCRKCGTPVGEGSED